jgi:hypothetical protein
MKKAISILLLVCLSGCAGMTKWECANGSCPPKEQAINKCLAQADSAFSRDRSTIWEQCMRGKGFREVQCADHERDNPECKVYHVF